jgi:NAD(P)-dependent dehydrogenase (short-subunit alcohol dehydrogenase family)
MFNFDQRVVIVTGASGNLGNAVARAFLDAGARLALLDHDADKLRAAFPEQASDSRHLMAGLDVTDDGAVRQTIDRIVERYGRIDVLVNTVGGYRAGTPLHQTPLERWDFMMNLNARSVLVVSQAVIPHMLQQHSGKIVNIASRAGLVAGGNDAAYSAAKSAVLRLTESAAAELKHQGINVNCVIPGRIDTPQNRAAAPDADYSRWVSPASLAEVILFLASPAARDIHGAALPVYGMS